MKKPFEDCLDFIENQLGCKLLDYQKILLRKTYENKHLYYCGNRLYDTHWIYNIMQQLKKNEQDNGKTLVEMCRPNGYSAAIVVYDENFKQTEFEKENKL